MSIRRPQETSTATVVPAPEADAPTRRTTSRELFGEARLLLIDHEGETYALRRTRLGKLILTK